MADDYTLLTPENVELRFDVAGIGSRIAAAAIDYSILSVGLTILLFGGTIAVALVAPRNSAGGAAFGQSFDYIFGAIVILLAFFGWWGYFILFDVLWNGQSPGKRMVGLRVVRAEGQPVTALASLIRNLIRAIDVLAGIGVLVMLLDRRSRRLGDFAAGTLVVREPRAIAWTSSRAFAPIELPAVEPRPAEASVDARALTMEQYTIIRDYFARRGKLPPKRAATLGRELAERFAVIVGAPAGAADDPTSFLAALAHSFEERQSEGA
jgi:uncharacterized RDD family membrane protein YckC